MCNFFSLRDGWSLIKNCISPLFLTLAFWLALLLTVYKCLLFLVNYTPGWTITSLNAPSQYIYKKPCKHRLIGTICAAFVAPVLHVADLMAHKSPFCLPAGRCPSLWSTERACHCSWERKNITVACITLFYIYTSIHVTAVLLRSAPKKVNFYILKHEDCDAVNAHHVKCHPLA